VITTHGAVLDGAVACGDGNLGDILALVRFLSGLAHLNLAQAAIFLLMYILLACRYRHRGDAGSSVFGYWWKCFIAAAFDFAGFGQGRWRVADCYARLSVLGIEGCFFYRGHCWPKECFLELYDVNGHPPRFSRSCRRIVNGSRFVYLDNGGIAAKAAGRDAMGDQPCL